ncbi:MAG: sugar phosphate isomerase/epimerase [Clostridia bacterium]|nr:sugar phosphate isomerase/epimerase [Clostridia bacterium]
MSYTLAAFADEAGSSLTAQIAALQRNGIGLLEIRGVDGKSIADVDAGEAKEIARRLADAGLAVRSIGSPYGKIGINDDFGPHFEKFRRTLEVAGILGASYMRIFSFFIPAGTADYSVYTERVMRRLVQLEIAARSAGIVLCHENEKGIYGDVPERCLEIHRAIPEIRAVFDPANYVQCGVDTLHAWELLRQYAEYLHIKDALPSGKVVPAGQGVGNVPRIVREFGSGMLTLEPHLSVFKGLAALEKDGGAASVDPYRFSTADEAFDCAAGALKALIAEKEE